ncbi:desmoplakin-B [Entelurus aequoreus]|uniref:desmoplakin-B n=1 Tax=Entelurus aequoreus TaxID=161455 RepID=UPI002B1D1709|nr:desmoplakin-B [Entelurus aequoreus]
MSQYDSQNTLTQKGDLTAGGSIRYSRSEFVHGGGNGYHSMERYNTFSKSSVGGLPLDSGRMEGAIKGGLSGINDIHQRTASLQAQCQEDLRRAEIALQSGDSTADAERYMLRAKGTIDHLKNYAMDLRQMGQPNDNVVKSWEVCNDQLKGVHLAMTGSMQRRRRSAKGGSGSWEEPGRSFHDAVAWITQQKHLIGTASWGEDPEGIEKHLISHQRFHNSIQNSPEVERARNDLVKKGDKGNLHALEQEWDSLQKKSFGRLQQLEDLQQIIQDMSKEIMWVNDKEEEELIFDWGEKNIDQYIPKKQESYSKLMSALEEKEKHLNKLKVRVDTLLKNNHPASDKIEAYRDTLQTQWSWLLQITKCMDVHLKENAAYNQFFKEANETYRSLQTEQETLCKKFNRDKNTSLDNLLELLMELEREREKIMDHKRQVQHLVNKAKTIVRLKPRNPEEKSSTPVIVKALCDFKQDQKVICKGDEAILQGNSQRSKWEVTGPGGLDMTVPSVCLIIPPPNPLSISLATKNEQYFESILSIWNQLYINIKSLIAWQYCLLDIDHINSLTISMLATMHPEEYRNLIKSLETHYEEFKLSCQGSQMFADNDKRSIESQFNGAQTHYETLVVQLPTYINAQQVVEQPPQQQLFFVQLAAEEDTRDLEEERQRAEMKKVKVTKTEKKKVVSSSRSLTELHTLRLKLESAEGLLSQHIHVCFGDDEAKDCSLKIIQLEDLQHDVSLIREEYLKLREHIMKELESMSDSDKAAFLQSELGVINQRLDSLESSSSAYFQRLEALRDLLQSMARTEDIVKVHEARLTEHETTSLLPRDVNDYMRTLKSNMEELDQKIDVLASMEAELANAKRWNDEVGGPFHRCDIMLSKYAEQVDLLSDRWKRIQTQMDNRLQDLQRYLLQLEHYKQTSPSLSDWIDNTRKKQDILRTTKIQTVEVLKDHIKKEKALNADIKAERSTVESVLKDSDACVNSIKEYETDLACYASGLETLLNIPIKKTMLRSPSMDLTQEATQLQTRYLELLTLSDGYLKFLGELLKNMEELKIRSTRIDLLEEELCMLREDIQDRNAKNKSLEDAVSRYQLELSQSNEKLLSVEEIKRTTALQCSDTKDSLDTTQNQLADLSDQVTRLNFLLEEERRRRKLAEERYSQQKQEYDSVLKKRHTELENVSLSKVEVENNMANKDHEIEQLRQKLAAETSRGADLQKEILKVRSQCSAEINKLMLNYESQMHVSCTKIQRLSAQRVDDTLQLQVQLDRMVAERINTEEELRRIKMSINQADELKKKAEEEAHRQCSIAIEEGHKRRELEIEMEVLMKHREEERCKYKEELAAVRQELEEKTEQLTYVTYNLEEEVRRRKTTEEGQDVLEQTLTKLKAELTSSAKAVTQLREREADLQNVCLTLERENRQQGRVEETLSRLQGRIKDLQAVRDGLEIQLDNLRTVNQEEVSKRRQIETELENTSMAVREYTCTITALRQSQEQAVTSERRGEKQCLMLQDELERSLKQSKTSAEQLSQLSSEWKALQQQLYQEQAKVKEVNQKNKTLHGIIAEKSKALNESYSELQTLKENTDTLTKEMLRLENELRTTQHDKDKVLRFKQESDDELSFQITALELQLQASERSNVDYCNLVSELSLERENLKLKTTEIQMQTTETSTTMQLLQSQYGEIVKERDALLLKLQLAETEKNDLQSQREDLRRIRVSHESELQNKHRLEEENDRLKQDLSSWKEQYETKQNLARQYDADKRHVEKENSTLKSEIQRLLRELSDIEETYKRKLLILQKELTELTVVRQTMQDELTRAREPPTLDPSTVIFDGIRKPVTAAQLLDCGALDQSTFNQLIKGQMTVHEVSLDKKVILKGTGPIAGVIIENPEGDRSISGFPYKITLTEAKKEGLLPAHVVDLLLDAQAATGHIIDPRTNQKLTVEEACHQGIIDEEDRQRLKATEAVVVGYRGPATNKPLSVFQAMKKGLVDKTTTLRLLQAQESVGGILDPTLSVFLPKDTAIERKLIDNDMYRILNQKPELYSDPDSETDVTYFALKRKCKVDPHTGLLLLSVLRKLDPSKIVFDALRKPVTAMQLLGCGILDKSTFKDLEKGKITVQEVSIDKHINLKGTGPIAGIIAGVKGKMSLSEAKRHNLLSHDCADLLLGAQAATGHVIDPITNTKLTVEEAVAARVVDTNDRERLLAAQAAAVGYKDASAGHPLSVYEAMKKGLIDKKMGIRLLQAQECVGGILDPNLSVFLPKDIAISRNILDVNVCNVLNQNPKCYLDAENEQDVSYGDLRKRCKTEAHTGLLLLPITERKDPSKLIFDGVRKPVTAHQLHDCGILDKHLFTKLTKREKTVLQVSDEKRVFLKGLGSIAGVAVGSLGIISLSEAKKQLLIPQDCADLLLDAQAATGHIIDPRANQRFTVEEACAKGVVDRRDRDRLLAAESAAVGYRDPSTSESLSVFGAMNRGIIDSKTGLRLLQAQESAGGFIDPNISVFFPKDIALKRNLLDKELCKALNQSTACYLDPDTECDVCYEALKKKCKTQLDTGLIILPVVGRKDPSKLMFDGVRKPVSAKQLFDCGVIDKSTLDHLVRGEKTVSEVSAEKNVYLKGNGPIAGVAGHKGKMSLLEAKKQCLLSPETADLLLEAQAATGYIIDPSTYQKLTVEEACARGVVDTKYKDQLLVAEAAAVGYMDPSLTKPLSVYEAIKNGLIDRKTGLRFLQAQECVGGILDPGLSVFLPIDMAIKRNLIDADLCHALNQCPAYYLNPDPELDVSYGVLNQRCETEHHTGLKMLPISEKNDPSKLIFDGVRKTITAKQLFDCGILDKLTLNQLIMGERTVPEVSAEKNVFLKGTGIIAGVATGSSGNISFTQAKKENIMSADSADLLLGAQAATGHMIDPRTNQKMTVKEACTRGLVSKEDESKLFAAVAAAIGYREPNTSRLLSAGQAMKKGLIDKDTALRILQVQECTGGILDPTLSVYLPRDIAMDRSLIDADLYEALGQYPECFLDPDTQLGISYLSLKEKCRKDQGTGLLLLPEPTKPKTVQGLRDKVSVIDLLHAQLLEPSDIEELKEGRLTIQDIEYRLRSYLGVSTCIAGVYDEASDKVMTFYKAMKDGLMQSGTTLELLEAQAATGFVVDPVNNTHLTVSDAYYKGLFGPEFKDNMLLAEKAVTGYQRCGTNGVISLFQAIEVGLVEKAHGIRMLEAQIASGGIIDPEHSHRIDVNVAHLRGYIDEKMKKILTDQDVDTKGFIDPNTEEKLTYTELKKRCITDKKTGLIVLPIADKIKQDASIKNTTRERRIVIVDPETNKEMTVREAYNKGYIDYTTFMELSQQECEWEEITITSPDGAKRFVIIDRKTGREYDISELLEKGVIDHSVFNRYQSRIITLTQFADIITEKTEHNILPPTNASVPSSMSSSSTVSRNAVSLSKMTPTIPPTIQEQSSATKSVAQDSTNTVKQMSSVSITLASPVESVSERDPVGAIFDTETLEKISITEAIKRGLVDNITGLRLLEAQSCTGGIINPANGHRLGIQEASRLGIINDDMATKLKPAQKAFFGFEDVKTGTKMSVAEAIKEMWVPYEAGQRFMEFQFVTGGLYDPELGCRRTIADALKIGWINGSTATKLQDISHHTKILTCPKSKLKISYQEALDNCLVEESTGVKMLQASSVSSRGISSPYNFASAPGSSTGSRTGSQRSSRRNSLDLGSPTSVVTSHHSHTRLTSLTTRSEKNQK